MKPASRRAAQVMRLLTLAGFVFAGFLLWRLVDRDSGFETVEGGDGAVSVQDAIAIATGDDMKVTGYVFVGAGWPELRLCNGKETYSRHRQRSTDTSRAERTATTTDDYDADVPRCLGPFLYIEGVDEGSFDFEEGDSPEGPVQWTPEPVSLVGPILGTTITVQPGGILDS